MIAPGSRAGTIASVAGFLLQGKTTMTTNMSNQSAERPIVTTTDRAREGVTGHHVRAVLTVSLIAVVIIFGGLWLYYFA